MAHERLCILGGPGTGKTARLVERAAALVEAGAAPESVLALCATPNGCAVFKERLRARLGELGAGVRVAVPRALELEVLASDAARAFTGRDPHVLLNYEANVLMEDLKTTGVRPGRLKEMLKFFYRGWTELADGDPLWLVSDEEVQVHRLLKDCLLFSRRLHEAEVANLAVRFLRSDKAALAAVCADHVLVDDADELCWASQELASMLARASLTVAGDTYGGAEVFEPYPSLAKLGMFAAEPGVELVRLRVSHRPRAVVEVLNRMRADMDATARALEVSREQERAAAAARLANLTPAQVEEALAAAAGAVPAVVEGDELEVAEDAPAGSVETLVLADADEEARAVAACVAEALAAGVAPERVAVGVPNRLWATAVERALAQDGVAAGHLFDLRGLNGDVRDVARCVAAQALTLIRLAADPADAQAWRCWCGFGDWLANSPALGVLRTLGRAGEEDLAQVLAALAVEGGPEGRALFVERCGGKALGADERASLERVYDAYEQGRGLAAQLTGYAGDELARRAVAAACGPDAAVPPAVAQACAGRDAAAAVAWVAEAADAGRAFAFEDGVRIGSLEALAGLEPELLVLCGCVNGLVPAKAYFDEVATSPDRRRSWRIRELRRLATAVGASRGQVVASAFTAMDAVRAERLGLKVDRIKVRDGRRVAVVGPSVFCELLG